MGDLPLDLILDLEVVIVLARDLPLEVVVVLARNLPLDLDLVLDLEVVGVVLARNLLLEEARSPKHLPLWRQWRRRPTLESPLEI